MERLDGVDGAGLQGAAQSLADQLGDGAAVVIVGLPDPGDMGKVILVAAFGKQVIAAKLQAGKFIGGIAKQCGGGGGGRPNLAQAGPEPWHDWSSCSAHSSCRSRRFSSAGTAAPHHAHLRAPRPDAASAQQQQQQ